MDLERRQTCTASQALFLLGVMPPPPPVTPEENHIALRISPGADVDAQGTAPAGVPVLVSILPPEGKARMPCDICCVVDVSGSMGSEAMLKAEDGAMTGHGLSVLDIVKHALKTIIRNLGPMDRMALVSYSDKAKTIFDLSEMNEAGRSTTEGKLSELNATGMTNLWDGLKTGVDLLREKREPGRMQHIMLFTDGMPNINPPRGIIPMLQRLKQKEADGLLPCTVNTFGFGYELDSSLLSQLAIEGSGAYAFIPDAGFVGTVFVNAMSNLLVTMAKDVTVTMKPLNGAAFVGSATLGGHPTTVNADGSVSVSVGVLQFGQAKDVVVQMTVPPAAAAQGYLDAKVEYTVRSGGRLCATSRDAEGAEPGFVTVGLDTAASSLVEPQRLRLRFVDTVRDAIQALKQTAMEKAADSPPPLERAQALVQALASEIRGSKVASDEAVAALLEDLLGQVSEAFSRADWYTKWGVHYLPSLMFAHLTQQCNNFKDAGVQVYGGELFQTLRDAADEIFLSLPAPTPSAPPPAPVRAPTASWGAGAPIRSAPAPAALINMAAYHDRYSGCFDVACQVRMADGSLKAAGEVRAGDHVASCGRDGAEVICVVKTPVDGDLLDMVELPGGLRITPHHPVWSQGSWQFPADLATAQKTSCEAICTFLLEEGAHEVEIQGVRVVSLGHGLREGIAAHPFFGSRSAVESELQKFPTYATGTVELGPMSAIRDPETGLVCGLRRSEV